MSISTGKLKQVVNKLEQILKKLKLDNIVKDIISLEDKELNLIAKELGDKEVNKSMEVNEREEVSEE